MVRYNNGDPALVERQVGLGHVILAASSSPAASGTTCRCSPATFRLCTS